mmetsp:Transcript_37939/g.84519  ORF Transcript_37939/g.84519 Transcript_37939/m.84519 type:complete len:322 (+) Transcript_37939:393-1358(+)|eukprot:CAMPEP_0202912654 /NCGR_PEP_ID=MMETSP1392-20130828/58330_1 /ASSEMBLY_ACC=CAM_ASM_000868 /TAXON_ID=225041 /ORGANISM="Chlamydomonas chlamydogama, Strain SAG 11-48b" /LENGTH=321 /DNA_ID=CAMNT_0049603643 /DNA_START=342 /DNA_END=1307 /DNA_ORIENTATION=-
MSAVSAPSSLGSSPDRFSAPSSRSVSLDGSSSDGTGKGFERGTERSFVDTASSFNPTEYLNMHKAAVEERLRKGPLSKRMLKLYRYWCVFLRDNYNDAMYRSFKRFAEEDASCGHLAGMKCLFSFLEATVSERFDKDLFTEFEDLAHRYHDYLGYPCGVTCLRTFLLNGGAAEAAAAGMSLHPDSVVLMDCAMQLSAADAQHEMQAAWLSEQHTQACYQLSKGLQVAARAAGNMVPHKPRKKRGKVSSGSSSCTGCSPAATSFTGKKASLGHAGPAASSAPRFAARPRIKIEQFFPQAEPQPSLLPEASSLPDRLGELLGD